MLQKSDVLKELGEKLIKSNKDFEKLTNLSICYLVSDKKKAKGLKVVFADTEKVSEKWRLLSGYDFLITFYADAMDSGLSEKAMELLMTHELMHVGYDPDKDQKFIRPHDVDDFRALIEANGFDWIDS